MTIPLLALSACSSEPYPHDIQQELFNYCKEGISSGLTVVHHGKHSPMTAKEVDQLCQFRLNEFITHVPLSDYMRFTKHIYLNYQRAFANKYVLADIYQTLSPDDKAVSDKIATIILGLEKNAP